MDRDRIRWLRWIRVPAGGLGGGFRRPPRPGGREGNGFGGLRGIGPPRAALSAFSPPTPAYIWLASEAVIDRRYTLPRSLVRADSTPDALARGARLAVIDGC